jgi:primosomal protein N' (replication factor Y)
VGKETPETCPECGGKYIYFVGVGTEQLEEILRARLPTARMARVDRDSTRRRGSLRTVLLDFAEGRLDVLVGTQLVAKGHDFPNVTLVGVVCADAGLGLPDFRSAERTFQLLTQVAGRAGRGQSPGRVIIQAHYPDHYALRFARNQDYQGFFAQEIEFRRLMSYPPFTSLAQILITHRDQETGFRIGESIGAALKYQAGELRLDPRPRILGPAAAPIEKLKGSYRIQLLIKAAEPEGAVRLLQAAFEQLGRQRVPLSAVQVDVDPLSLM